MHRLMSMKRLSLMFVAVFAVLAGATLAYQTWWAAPGDRCEAGGRWWWAEERRCVQPVSLAEITGRPSGVTRAQASDAKNRELLQIEDRLAAEKAARAADADVQRARLKETQGR